ncbi:hypothetical protein [Gordonia sp. SL306]|uniref:hypothetical protein n=1 Tax=Gordonia sp. SL306 TaxID=2995145 RepID=UPI0022701994|nr:hypothetical protein [Gordonia sp. SL306]WAC57066.1 hypothetical protein OVA31_07410 [Gordonia sp. SL306]
MTKNEALKEIDSHLSSLSSASHSKLTMPEVKVRRRQLHVWRAQVDAAHDGEGVLDEIISEVYATEPIRTT